MAQSGRAPAWGVGGRRFESDHPDQKKKETLQKILEGLFFVVDSLSVGKDAVSSRLIAEGMLPRVRFDAGIGLL